MMATYLQEKLEEIWNENITKDSKVSKLKAVSAASASGGNPTWGSLFLQNRKDLLYG